MINGYTTSELVMAHVVHLLPTAVAVPRALLFPSPRRLDRWLEGHGLATTGPGRDLARRYLSQTRWIRSAGLLLGWTVAPLAWLWFGPDGGGRAAPDYVPIGLVTFAIAVLVAEVVRPRPAGTMAATAPRLRDTYIPTFTRWDPIWIGVAFAALIALAVAYGADPGRQIRGAAVAGAAWLAMVALQRWILDQSQRADSLEMLRVDDAIRSTGATALSALGYGVSVVSLGSGLWSLVQGSTFTGTGHTVLTLFALGVWAAGLSLTVGFLRLENTWLVPRLREAAR